ncbi:hypothetical protein K5D56_25440 [Pseudomonas cichorii]|nr:hypothetical protein [Pseudomonas cichorii]
MTIKQHSAFLVAIAIGVCILAQLKHFDELVAHINHTAWSAYSREDKSSMGGMAFAYQIIFSWTALIALNVIGIVCAVLCIVYASHKPKSDN